MNRIFWGALLSALGLAVSATPVWAAQQDRAASSSVFIMTNDAARNEVLAYQRIEGSWVLKGRIATGGRGSGGTADPLQSQGSLTLSQDHTLLFAVNAGSGTLSSFQIIQGMPVLVDRKPVGGAFPVSVAERNHALYVLDAGGNGAIVPFRVDPFGHLYRIAGPVSHLTAANDGASDVLISPDGSKLVVVEKTPDNIDVFPIQPDGTLGTVVVNKSVAPGAFSEVFAPDGTLVVTENQPDGTDVSTVSSYSINGNGTLHVMSQSEPTYGDGACWNSITPNGKWVYVQNAATGTIAGFALSSSGTLTPVNGTIVYTYPAGAINIDSAISGNGRYLYNINTGTGTVGVFSINADGSLTSLGQIEGLPARAGLNGIAAL